MKWEEAQIIIDALGRSSLGASEKLLDECTYKKTFKIWSIGELGDKWIIHHAYGSECSPQDPIFTIIASAICTHSLNTLGVISIIPLGGGSS